MRLAVVAIPMLVVLACAAPPGPAPSWDELGGATYDGVGAVTVTLREGRWLGEPFEPGGTTRPYVTLVDGFRLEGDLDGTGSPEAVVLLAASEGGSGTFVHLAVVGRRGPGVVSRATARVGDRVQVRSGSLDGDRVVLELLQAGPDDAACCPTEKARRTWRFEGADLAEVDTQTTGPISLLDLVGPEWVLVSIEPGEPLPASPQATLVVESERVQGHGGCNRYFAAVAPSGARPTDLALGPIGATRMACPEPAMALESRYLSALGAVEGFGFAPGRLVLRWVRGEERGALLFEPR